MRFACVFLLGFPFACAGVYFSVMVGWSIYDYQRMSSWVETPVTILDVALASDEGMEELIAEYEYVYDKQEYGGSRVAIINIRSDSVFSFKRRRYEELSWHHKQKKPFRCYVNPGNPQESVIYRELRWDLMGVYTLSALVFGGVGGVVIGRALYAYSASKDQARRALKHPDQPWLWRSDWAAGYAEGSAPTKTLMLIGFTVCWNAVSGIFAIPAALADDIQWGLFTGLFTVLGLFIMIGLILILVSAVAVIQSRKYGRTRFQMAATPGVIGGPLAGAVVAKHIDSVVEFYQALYCYEQKQDSNGQWSEQLVWDDSRTIKKKIPTAEPDKSAIPVLFHIPYQCKPTSMKDEAVSYSWELEVTAETPGVDFKSKFEVPVFRTPASSEDYKPDDSMIAEFAEAEDSGSIYRRIGVERQYTGEQLYLHFGYGRNLAASLVLIAVLVSATAATAEMVMWEIPIVFPVVFGIIDLLILRLFVGFALNTSRFVVDAKGIRGKFGILHRFASFKVAEILRVKLSVSLCSGKYVYYDLQLEISGGRDVVIGKAIHGRANAKHVAEEILRALKRSDMPPIDINDGDDDDGSKST